MKLVSKIKLNASQEDLECLKLMVDTFNKACNYTSEIIQISKITSNFKLHKLYYKQIKEKFCLPAQVTCNVMKRSCQSYKVGNKKKTRSFSSNSSVIYDDRMISFKDDQVSILTLNKRRKIPLIIYGDKPKEYLKYRKGEVLLKIKNNKAYLHITCDIPEEPKKTTNGFLGVDLGIVNIATCSDGTNYSGSSIDKVRNKYQKLKSSLQKKHTRSCLRKLKKTSGKQSRFVKNTNHVISKQIVTKTKALDFGIALEELSKIKTPVSKAQKLRHDQWSFFQLRQFIQYKSELNGIEVVLVNPRNTSRQCSKCGYINKKNRKTRDSFQCLSCNFSARADDNAAINIAAKASINRLNVAGTELLPSS